MIAKKGLYEGLVVPSVSYGAETVEGDWERRRDDG
jgi:hypothetical protein